MKFLIFLASLSTSLAFNNPVCRGKRYYCSPDNSPMTCINVTDPKGKVHFLQKCPTDYYCPYWQAGIGKAISCVSSWVNQTTANVTKLVNVNKTLIVPGEGCSKNEDCSTNSCVGGFCKGATLNATCANHEDCEPSLFCNNKACKSQVAFNEVIKTNLIQKCSSTWDCTNNCVCNVGKCAYFYSLDNGIASDNSGPHLSFTQKLVIVAL